MTEERKRENKPLYKNGFWRVPRSSMTSNPVPRRYEGGGYPHVASLCRVYGDRDVDALAALRKVPKIAAGVLAKRLREKKTSSGD